jgi:hypothetical protein
MEDDFLSFDSGAGFGGISDVAPLDFGGVEDMAGGLDDSLQQAFQSWLDAGNEGTLKDFLTSLESPTASGGMELASLSDATKADTPLLSLEKSAFEPTAATGGAFGMEAPAPQAGSFAMPAPALPQLAPTGENDPFTAPSWLEMGTPNAPPMPANLGIPAPELPNNGGLLSFQSEPGLDVGNRRLPSFMDPAYDPKQPLVPQSNDPRDPIRRGIIETANALGIKPVDLATAISYETAGTFDPTKAGPRTQWGRHRGLIQFGEPQAQRYGVDWNKPVESQLGPDGAVAKYLRDTGVKPGMGLLDVYSAINAGGVGRYNRTDANNGGAPGTVRDKVEQQMDGHRAKAEAFLSGEGGVADAPGAFRAAAARQAASAAPRAVSASAPAMRDPGMFSEAAPSDMGMRLPSPSVMPPRAAPVTSAPQGRQTMPQISPDEELYSLGMMRDPAGGGMIQNVAIRPPGMAMGSDGAYVDAGSMPAAAPMADGPAGFGGFGGIATTVRNALGMGGGDAPSAPSGASPAPRSAPAAQSQKSNWFTPQMDAFLGGLSAALMSNNGAAFAPTYQAILASANQQAETAGERAAIAMVLQKQGLPAEEAATLARSPAAAKMAIDVMQKQREQQQMADYNRGLGNGPSATPSPSPPAAPQGGNIQPPNEQAAAPQNPQAPRQGKDQAELEKDRLLALRAHYSMKFKDAPNDIARQNTRVLIDQIDAQIKRIDSNKPERDSFQPVKDEAGNIVGRFNTRTGATEPLQAAGEIPKIPSKSEREAKEREATADRLELKGDERKFYLANGRVPTAGEKLTEQQSKDIVFYNRGVQALEVFDGPLDPKNPKSGKVSDVFASAEGAIGSIGNAIPVVGGYLATENYKKADQAGRNFLASILRKDSGAAVTAPEMDQYGRIFFPRPGDGPEVLKQKADARRQALDAIKAGLNPFAESKLVKPGTEAKTAPATQSREGKADPLGLFQ